MLFSNAYCGTENQYDHIGMVAGGSGLWVHVVPLSYNSANIPVTSGHR